MMKKLICLMLIIFVLSVSFMGAEAESYDGVTVYVNGEILKTDQGGIIFQDRTLVPVRAICEALNCEVSWREDDRSVNVTNNATAVRMQIDSRWLTKENIEDGEYKQIDIDVAPMIVNGRTLLPLRALCEALNATVEWDGVSRSAYINLEYDCVWDFEGDLAKVEKDGKYGYINKQRELVVGYADEIGTLSDGMISAKKDGKWGYYDEQGEIAVTFKYRRADDFSEGLASVSEGYKWGVIDKSGNVVVPFIYDNINEFSEGLAAAEKNYKWGYINKYGEEVMPFIYDHAGSFNNGKAIVLKGESSAIISKNGEIEYSLSDSMNDYQKLTPSESNGKWGYINNSGEVVIDYIYDFADDFSEGLASVEKDGMYGVINEKGDITVDFSYDYIYPFKEGIAKVNKDWVYGYINSKGEEVIPVVYNYISGFDEKGIACAENSNEKYGYIDKSGKTLIAFVYDYANEFSEDAAPVCKDGKYGFINRSGETVIAFQYTDAGIFSMGLAAVRNAENKWGYINKSGELVIPYTYDYAEEFGSNGAFVKLNDEYVTIDTNGIVKE